MSQLAKGLFILLFCVLLTGCTDEQSTVTERHKCPTKAAPMPVIQHVFDLDEEELEEWQETFLFKSE